MSDLEWVRGEDGVGKYAPMPGGGSGSLPALVVRDPTGGSGLEVAPGNPFFMPPDVWEAVRDDLGALQEDGTTIILPSGLYLSGGALDTANDWTGATGEVLIRVSADLVLLGGVPCAGVLPAHGIAALVVPPPMILLSAGANEIGLTGFNLSDQTLIASGAVLWALRVADAP